LGGYIAILGVIVLPITSGDTALRSLRLMIADFIHLDQRPTHNRLYICVPVFALVIGILYWAKSSPGGFNMLWRYFAWSNQTISIFAFAIITIYMLGKGHQAAAFMSLLPGMWYAFITFTFICNAQIGFNLPMNVAYVLGVIFAFVYGGLVYTKGNRIREAHTPLEAEPVYAKGY
jgi:carbon starvation protein CstA